MYEDRPEKDTPEAVRALLREYGGVTAHGWPIWRLVLAENCRMQCFGVMRHAPRVKDTSELDLRETAPERVEEGVFWLRRYPQTRGWILQRWFPPHVWGARQDWERQKAEDGVTRMRGKFPAQGDYFLMAGPWRSIEMAGDLRLPIQALNRAARDNPTNFETYFRQQLREERREQQEQIERFETTLEIYRRTEVLPILKSASPLAQRARNRVQQQIHLPSHLGASDAWGG